MRWLSDLCGLARAGSRAATSRRVLSYRPRLDVLEGREAPVSLLVQTSPGVPATAAVGQAIPLDITVTEPPDRFAGGVTVYVNWGDGVTDTLTLTSAPGTVFRGSDSHSYGPAAQGQVLTVVVSAVDDGDVSGMTVAGSVMIPAAAAESPMGNATSNFLLLPGKVSFNSGSGNTKLPMQLKNNSDQTIQGPFYVVLSGLKHSIKLTNGTLSKMTSPGNYFLVVPGDQLAPGQSLSFTLNFHNSSGGKVSPTSYHAQVFAGVTVS